MQSSCHVEIFEEVTDDVSENNTDTDDTNSQNDQKTSPVQDDQSDQENFVCDHEIKDVGYISVFRVKRKTIRWNDGSVDEKNNLLDDLELDWDSEDRVYLSTNEADDDDTVWVRILKIVNSSTDSKQRT